MVGFFARRMCRGRIMLIDALNQRRWTIFPCVRHSDEKSGR
jgi:hypothetical protein